MNDLNIAASQSAPSVVTDHASGTVEMRGDSYPENSWEFFAPIISWTEQYLETSQRPLHMSLYLLYLNTSSVKAMMDLFDLMEAAHLQGREVEVKWYYDGENERIAELVEEFKEDCTFPFEIIRVDT